MSKRRGLWVVLAAVSMLALCLGAAHAAGRSGPDTATAALSAERGRLGLPPSAVGRSAPAAASVAPPANVRAVIQLTVAARAPRTLPPGPRSSAQGWYPARPTNPLRSDAV